MSTRRLQSHDDPHDVSLDLRDSEHIVARFRPKLTLFLQRTVVIGILTTIGFGAVPGLNISYPQQVGLALVVVVIWFFVFDEWRDWIDHRRDTWILTNERLIFENPDAEDSPIWWQLSDIQNVRRVFWWSLRIVDHGHRVTPLPYVGPVTSVRDIILRTKPQEPA